MIVASIAIATARPTPTSLMVGTPVSANDPNTTTMIAAADVMMRAEDAMPSATARSFDPCSSYRSRMRVSRNTS